MINNRSVLITAEEIDDKSVRKLKIMKKTKTLKTKKQKTKNNNNKKLTFLPRVSEVTPYADFGTTFNNRVRRLHKCHRFSL